MEKVNIYLDDVRNPTDNQYWTVVRSYKEFCEELDKHPIENIRIISFDHDLGELAMGQYFNNVSNNRLIDYNALEEEKTGLHCAQYLIQKYLNTYDESQLSKNDLYVPILRVHSANLVGSYNIIGLLENFFNVYLNLKENIQVIRWKVPFTISM